MSLQVRTHKTHRWEIVKRATIFEENVQRFIRVGALCRLWRILNLLLEVVNRTLIARLERANDWLGYLLRSGILGELLENGSRWELWWWRSS